MTGGLRQWLNLSLMTFSLAILGVMAFLKPGTPPFGNVALLFAIPAVVLLGTDWRLGGFPDNDFALGADMVLLVSSPGAYAILLVLARRMASLLTREPSARSASLSSATYVVVPPVAVGAALVLVSASSYGTTIASLSVVEAAVFGLAYLALDALFGLLSRATRPFWRWAVPANVTAYGLLWLSQVSLAVMAELTLPSLGLLAVALFALLAVLLRVAYGFMRRVLRLYAATAEALAVALEATIPDADWRARQIAIRAHASARNLGFPDQDASLVESGAWLRSIVGRGFPAPGSPGFLEGEHIALADSLRIAEASENPQLEKSPRFRRLGFVLAEVSRENGDQGLSADAFLEQWAHAGLGRRAAEAVSCSVAMTRDY